MAKAFIGRHAVLTFVVLVFALSWGGMFLAVGPGGLPAGGPQNELLLGLAYMGMLAGPSVAGLLLLSLLDGRAGWRELWARLLTWRVAVRWYALALLTGPLLMAAALLALSLLSPDFLPRLFTEADKVSLLQFSLVVGLLVGVFEELGWTGFVLPRLRRRYSLLTTGLILGAAYAAWNALVVFWVSNATAGAGDLPVPVFLLLTLFTWLPTYRVLMVWVYEHTHSLLVAMLMHASLIAFWRNFTPLALTGSGLVTFYLVFSAAMWVVIATALRPHAPPLARGAPPKGLSF